MKYPWFKVYTDMIHDMKIRRMTTEEKWLWVTLLCLASENETRGQVSLTALLPYTENDFSVLSGIDESLVKSALIKYEQLEMIEIDSIGMICIQNYSKRQNSNLNDAERSEKYRKNKKSDARHAADVTTVTLEKRRVDKKRIEKKRKDSLVCDPLFSKFWEAYPKKKSLGQAEKTWNKLKPNEQLVETMISTIERAKTSDEWTKKNGQFIPNPSSWLNAKGWKDEFDTPVKTNRYQGVMLSESEAFDGLQAMG